MLAYQEFAPPSELRDAVECFWMSHQAPFFGAQHRVLPDGCSDLIYTRADEKASLQFVGAMTQYCDFFQPAGALSIGVRFRPGMCNGILGASGPELADQIIPLEALWERRARRLHDFLDSLHDPRQLISGLACHLPLPAQRSSAQSALLALEQSHGSLSVADLARSANLSTRQFRRQCLDLTSLSPKLLARILRFRYANAQAMTMAGNHATLAAECGYADQSHFIAECQRFAGHSPAQKERIRLGL